jgi:maleylacetoacetate isomerase
MKLYTYWRSSAAYRVRIALNLKGLEAEHIPIHLVKDGGEQKSDSYKAINPHGLIPALEDDGLVLSNSLAIIEYLEEKHPEPPLLPGGMADRARIRQISQAVACDIHPVQNLRVLQYVAQDAQDKWAAMSTWAKHFIELGFDGLEAQLAREAATGMFAHGDSPTLADICLVPMVANARRYGVDMALYPTLARIDDAAREVPAFEQARPENQPDAE